MRRMGDAAPGLHERLHHRQLELARQFSESLERLELRRLLLFAAEAGTAVRDVRASGCHHSREV